MTPERKEYIKKLESQIEAINRILKMDFNTVINDNVKNELKKLSTSDSMLGKIFGFFFSE